MNALQGGFLSLVPGVKVRSRNSSQTINWGYQFKTIHFPADTLWGKGVTVRKNNPVYSK